MQNWTMTNWMAALDNLPKWRIPSVGDLLRRALDTLFVWQTRAEQRHRLLQLDDRMLRDMGIGRAAAYRETSKPFWRE